jgi:hypothetical protein
LVLRHPTKCTDPLVKKMIRRPPRPRIAVVVLGALLLFVALEPPLGLLHQPDGTIRFLVRADFGDYVDPTFDCPATTTCQPICVAADKYCPTACDAGRTLCADGSCVVAAKEQCAGDLESPCEFDCAKFACAKVVDTYDACRETYGPQYEAETACGEAETAETVQLFQFNETGFVVVYAWVSIVSVLIFAWCFYK